MVDDYDNHEAWGQRHIDIFKKYRAYLCEHGYLDYAILILEAIEQIKNNPAVADDIKSIKYLVVDEYQDVDDLQEKLIHHFSKCGAKVCVVGDDDQTIYRFRGSNANNMIGFAKKYPQVTQIRLEKNFRCSPAVVDIADCVIKNNQNRIEKKMLSEGSVSDRTTTKAERFNSAEDEYNAIAEKISELSKNGASLCDIAVLVRKGKYINPICNALGKRGIAYATDSADYFSAGTISDGLYKHFRYSLTLTNLRYTNVGRYSAAHLKKTRVNTQVT